MRCKDDCVQEGLFEGRCAYHEKKRAGLFDSDAEFEAKRERWACERPSDESWDYRSDYEIPLHSH